MKIVIKYFMSLMLCLSWNSLVEAHSPSESNECVRTLLRVVSRVPCTGYNRGDRVFDFSNPDVFFSRINTGEGWSSDGRRQAFDDYLNSLGTIDYTSRVESQIYAYRAVGQCAAMNYTNAVPAIKRLLTNVTFSSRYRLTVMKDAVSLMDVSNESTSFIQSVFTNSHVYTLSERGVVSGLYVKKLLSAFDNGSCGRSVLTNATDVFYRQRMHDVAGGIMFDRLFVKGISGYDMSSNRLEFAHFILNHPDSNEYDGRCFSAVTNQLLSSGQSLRQLTIGEGGNE